MNRTWLIIIAVIVVLVAIGGFLAWNNMSKVNNQMMSEQQQTQPVVTTPSMSTDTNQGTSSSMMNTASDSAQGAVKEFVVDGSNFKFSPSTLTVNKGDNVKITFKNLQGTHDFVIDELGVKTPTITAGKDEVVNFVADEAGSFKYYCSVGNHRAQGMEGTLVVK